MLSLSGIHKAFGGQQVLTDVTWTVGDGTRVGLAGPNGAGKSTLLRMIAGLVEPDRGTIALPKGARVGYLPQHILGTRGISVRAQAMTAFAELHELEARRAALEHELATVDPSDARYADVMDRYVAVCDEWEHRGRYDTEAEADTVLHGLGFRDADLGRDCGELSGGWQMRVALATLLLQRPDVLLLDEPTNYLDLEARTWLEEFLVAYPGSVVLVAHDRYFLDVAVDHIAEVLHGRVTDYPMNYSRYLVEREVRIEQARAAYENQQQEIERIEAFISRFRYQASKAALVQSRVKQLEKIERLPPPEGHDRARAGGRDEALRPAGGLRRRRRDDRARPARGAGRTQRRGQDDAPEDAGRRHAARRRHAAPRRQGAARLLRAGPRRDARREPHGVRRDAARGVDGQRAVRACAARRVPVLGRRRRQEGLRAVRRRA
jgi:ATP-binding cassette subfamily F protein 3